MTIASTITQRSYTGIGSTSQFSFPNKVFSAGDLTVTVYDTSGNAYPFVNFANAALGWTYTVQNVDVDVGCIVALSNVLNSGWVIDIRSNVPELQSTSVKNQGQFLPELHEEAFDRATRMIQDLLRLTYTFGIHGPDTEFAPWPALPGPAARKGFALMFDAVTGLPELGFLSAQNVTAGLIGGILYPPLAAEGSTVVNVFLPYGWVDRYGTNTVPGATDMTAAVQAAVNANSQVTFQNTSYLFSSVTIGQPVVLQGQGFGTVLLAKTHVVGVTTYSLNMFTSSAAIDYITFKDLTLDGACNNANPNTGDNSEIPLVIVTATSKVTFNNVKVTRYCGSFNGTPKAISASFYEAIVVQNAARTAFLNCFFANNHYEVALVWNAPGSHNEVLIDGFLELNTGTPNAHSAFDLNGGHVTVVNSVWNNTGTNSQLNVQVAESVRVANNAFLSMQPGAAAQCNIGQDTFPYNSDVLIENNYFVNANSSAIAVGSGSSIVIRGNVIDTPGNYGIKLTAGVSNFTTFLIEYPEWPAPSASGSNSIVIEGNVINAVLNTGSLPCGIWLHTVNSNGGFWFKDVQIRGNTVTAGGAPNNTNFGIRLDDCQDLIIRDNWLQYTISGLYFETLVQNVLIEGNTFNGVPPSTSNDIIWVGSPTSSDVRIRRNRWNQWPVGQNAAINVFAGAVTGLEVIDNRNIHPTIPVQGPASTAYVQYQTNPNVRTTTAAPSTTGDFGVGDRISNVPTSGQPIEYICTVAGSFGSAPSSTVTGTTPNIFFTASNIAALHVGMHISIAGAGAGASALPCTVVYITGSTFYVDQVISTNVTGAAITLISPTFVKSGNYT